MPSFYDFYFDSSTGKNKIHARKCVPDGEPRAIIQINHGIAEHIERYDSFMNFLAENGFLVVGEDHLGHGQSVNSQEDLGFFNEEDGWNCVVSDINKLRSIIREGHENIPYIMFGHSMGSFLTRTYIIKYPENYDLCILSGTGNQLKPIVYSGYALASLLTKKNGPRGDGNTLNNIAFGNFNDKIPGHSTEFDWLSRDAENVQKYIDDPLCGFVAKTSLYRDMMSGIKFVTNQENINTMNVNAPVLFVSGDADPVGEYGKGVNRAYKAFCKAGLQDVTIRLYPGGRHEILNETNRDEVFAEILQWINIKLQKIDK